MQMKQVRFSGAGGRRLGIFGLDFDLPGIPGFPVPGAPAAPAPAPAAPAPAAPVAPEAGPSMTPAFLFPTTVQEAPAPAPAPDQEASGVSTETVLLAAGGVLAVVAVAAILS